MSSTHSIIRLRRGTAAEWAASLPQPDGEILKLGEPGYEKDTKKLKIGNGIDGWNNLDYINAGTEISPEDIEDIVGSGFLVAGTGINISYNDNADSLTISTSGVSFNGHSHVSSDITDFNSAVSGLLPVTNILGGSNIAISQSGTNFTVAVTGSLGLTSEEVDDRVNNLLVAGTGINLNYNDNSNILTISTSGVSLQGHSHTSDNITNFNDSVRDVAALVPLISLGNSVSGVVPINFDSDRQAQSVTLNGGATTFTLGSGWPPPGDPSTFCIADVFLVIFPQVSTSITWSIVTQWYNRPPEGPLPSGTIHLFLLRGTAGSLFNVQGHYIGSMT